MCLIPEGRSGQDYIIETAVTRRRKPLRSDKG